MRNNLVGLAVGVVCAIVMIGTTLAPVIADIQKTIGADVEYTNSAVYGSLLGYGDVSDTYVFSMDANGIYYNGTDISGTTTGFYIMTDSVSINVSGSSTNNVLFSLPESSVSMRPAWIGTHTITVTFENGTVTYTNTNGDVELSYSYSWIMVPSDGGEYQTIAGTTAVYVNSVSDIILSGYYSTGDNDTGYAYHNGELSVYEDFECSISYTEALVDGTTDVYTISDLTVTVGDESFVPYYKIVKTDISGHESGGTLYVLFGVVLTMTVLAVLCAVTYAVIRNRD